MNIWLEVCGNERYISGLENKEKNKESSNHIKRGWAGNNPKEYRLIMDAVNSISTMIGAIIVGHLLAEHFEQAWIFWLAIIFGVFVNMFVLAWKFIKMGNKKTDKREQETNDGKK